MKVYHEKLIWPSHPLIKIPKRHSSGSKYQLSDHIKELLKYNKMINFMISKISNLPLLKKKNCSYFLSTLFSQNDWKVLKIVTCTTS